MNSLKQLILLDSLGCLAVLIIAMLTKFDGSFNVQLTPKGVSVEMDNSTSSCAISQ